MSTRYQTRYRQSEGKNMVVFIANDKLIIVKQFTCGLVSVPIGSYPLPCFRTLPEVCGEMKLQTSKLNRTVGNQKEFEQCWGKSPTEC